MNKIYALLFSLVTLCCIFCSAQTRNPGLDVSRTNIWKFGWQWTNVSPTIDAPGLDFTNGAPVVTVGGPKVADGATSICDPSGNLQLYGGYLSMYNHTYSPLMNSGVVGDSGWIGISPTNLAVPQPNSPNLIYYFSTAATFRYSV
ncbi:MAG: hypothetical protein KIS94_15990 [Chitinophagales bacterium]|nr:hypothetical protein [Chitinophagales bacterium]